MPIFPSTHNSLLPPVLPLPKLTPDLCTSSLLACQKRWQLVILFSTALKEVIASETCGVELRSKASAKGARGPRSYFATTPSPWWHKQAKTTTASHQQPQQRPSGAATCRTTRSKVNYSIVFLIHPSVEKEEEGRSKHEISQKWRYSDTTEGDRKRGQSHLVEFVISHHRILHILTNNPTRQDE